MKNFSLPLTSAKVLVLGLLLGASSAHATPLVNLGTAGPGYYGVLEIGTGDLDISVNAGGIVNGITGNVGLNGSGTLSLTGGTFVNGNVIVAQNVNQVTTSGGSTISGSITVNQAVLTQARADALAAAAAATALGAGPGAINLGAVTSSLHLTTPGVYNITDLNLNQHDKLQLGGGGAYVFNISGDFKISGDSLQAGVFLDAGMSSSDVLFNYTNTADIAFSGGGAGDNSQVYGVILAPNAKVSLAPGTVFGEIIGGNKISIVSGSDVVNPPQTVPESGATLALLGIGLALIGAARKKLL